MSTLFRVEHPTSGIGLWYREDGVKVDFIRHELVDALNRDLPMDHDPDLVGGWFSAAESLEQLAQWVSASDVVQLRDRGHVVYAVEVASYRQAAGPYDHPVFRRELVVARRQVPWELLGVTS